MKAESGPQVALRTAIQTSDSNATSYVAGLKRRRAAAHRLPVPDSGHADPWRYESLPLTDNQLGAWSAAVEHLAAVGTPAVVPLDAARGIWRRGDRRLCEHLAVTR